MAKDQEINTKSEAAEDFFRHLTVTFNSYVGIKQPNLSESEHFYKVYSPKKIHAQTYRRYYFRFKIQRNYL